MENIEDFIEPNYVESSCGKKHYAAWAVRGKNQEMFEAYKKARDYMHKRGQIVMSCLSAVYGILREERRDIHSIDDATVRTILVMTENSGLLHFAVFSYDKAKARKMLDEVLENFQAPPESKEVRIDDEKLCGWRCLSQRREE